MALVRANDTFTLCEFGYETTYGTAPTYPGTGAAIHRRFPFVAENMKIETEVLPLSEEFTAFAGLSGVDLGKRRVRGTLTVEPQYDSTWFWMLFGLAFSYENVDPNKTLMNAAVTTPANGLNAHLFNHGNILKSATMYVWKAGPGPADGSHWVDRITGLYVTKWTWDQPEGNRAKVTLEFIGSAMTTVASNTLNGGVPQPIYTGTKINIQHLGTGSNAGLILFGNGSAEIANLNLTGFTINVDRKIDDTSGAFLNEILTANQPGIEGIREVTLNFTTNLETDYNATSKPWPLFVAGTQAAMHIKYDSGVEASTTPSSNYGVRFDIPGLVLTDAQQSISKAGVQTMTVSATCPLASLTRLFTTYDQWTTNDTPAIPSDNIVDIRVATVLLTDTAAAPGLGEHTDDAAVTGLGAAP